MVAENTKLFFRLYYQPRAALSDIIDHGNWLFGAILVTAIAMAFAYTVTNKIYYGYEAVPVSPQRLQIPKTQTVAWREQAQFRPEDGDDEELDYRRYFPTTRRLPLPLLGDNGWWLISFHPTSMLFIALSLAVLYVPALIMILALLERTSSFGVALRRDYGALLSCTFFAWAASHLPFALLGLALDNLNAGADVALLMWGLSNVAFGILMMGALITAAGANLSNAAIVVGAAWVVFRLDSWVFSILTFSPFFTLIWLVPLALGGIAAIRAAHSQRQSFRRYLDACTINEHDAEAHYQLGLIYQKRRQNEKALTHFQRAAAIDPKEPDANYQLGIVARLANRLSDAINHFSIVVAHNDKYQQSEIWREIGATYLAAGMLVEAKSALEKFHERRPYDPEGLYHLGELLSKSGEPARAREMYKQCLEAVKTMPYYRRNQVSKWGKLAQGKI